MSRAESVDAIDGSVHKPCIFVTSGGRTGTLFFARQIGALVPACDSFHEPDVITPPYLANAVRVIRRFGPSMIFPGKFRRSGGMRNLAHQRQRGAVSLAEAGRAMLRMRSRFVTELPGRLYCESNFQMLGLVDVLPVAFPNSTAIVLVRDGRTWITSFYRHAGGFYGARDLVYRFGLGRTRAKMFPSDPWYGEWNRFSAFQKHCWLWQKIYRYALEAAGRHPHARVWKYEDIFLGQTRYRVFREMMDFATSFPDGSRFEYGSLDGVLEQRVHESSAGGFPSWQDWSDEQVRDFQLICGGLMDDLGYGDERGWLERLSRLDVR